MPAEADVRMFGSSVLICCADARPETIGCRVMDFGQTYSHVRKRAAQFGGRVEDSEDDVIAAVGKFM